MPGGFERNGDWHDADVGMELNASSLVKTGSDGVLEIEVGEGAQVLFHEGLYGKTIPIFSEIISSEDDEMVRAEIAYYLGVSLFHNLRYQEAAQHQTLHTGFIAQSNPNRVEPHSTASTSVTEGVVSK